MSEADREDRAKSRTAQQLAREGSQFTIQTRGPEKILNSMVESAKDLGLVIFLFGCDKLVKNFRTVYAGYQGQNTDGTLSV